jgi:hypothetical protein
MMESVIDMYYVGDEYEGNIFAEYCQTHGLTTEISGPPENDLSLCEPVILDLEPKNLVINLNQCTGDEDEIASAVSSIRACYAGRIIIHAAEYSYDQSIIKSLIVAGINETDFIFAKPLGAQRRELEQIMSISAPPEINIKPGAETPPSVEPYDTDASADEMLSEDLSESEEFLVRPEGVPTANRRKKVERAEEIVARRESASDLIDAELPEALRSDAVRPPEYTGKRTIAVIGSMRRIGATTVALQIAKHFSSAGARACYIEHNDTGFLDQLREVYAGAEYSSEPSFVRYGGVDMYDDPAQIAYIRQNGYNVLVYDYGKIAEQYIPSALEKDAMVCVLGIKPSELSNAEWIYEKLPYQPDAYYAFNFVHKNDREDVLSSMEDLAPYVVFPAYSPDPFTFAAENISVFAPLAQFKKVETAKKERRIFG